MAKNLCRIFLIVFGLISNVSGVLAQSKSFYEIALDFMVQDICIDQNGLPLSSATPLDGQVSCREHRNLHIGENLPYHKHDWANDTSIEKNPNGLQRSDSFPVLSRGRTIVVDTFQLNTDNGSFDDFSHGDGGQIIYISKDIASAVFTQDSKGKKYLFGPNCTQPPSLESLSNSWILFDSKILGSKVSSLIARLQQSLDPRTCPEKLSSAFTEWSQQRIAYRRGINHELTEPMETIVTDHYSNITIARSGSMERMYFTKELGWTRWERWQNLVIAGDRAPEYSERASKVSKSGRCDLRDTAPANSSSWVMVDCREWTNLIKTKNPKGEPPTFWIQQLRESSDTAHFFGE